MSLGPPLVAATSSAAFTCALIWLLPRFGFVDRPNARSSHAQPVPRGGGLAVMSGVALGVLVAAPSRSLGIAIGLAAAAGLLGLLDDRWSLSVRARLLAQTLLAGFAALWLATSSSLGTGAIIGLALLWIAFVNAFNFMDGINGISAMVAIVASGWFVIVGPADQRVLGGVVAAAALGFLVFNGLGKIFLGDIGSYSLGSLIWSMTALSMAGGAGVVESVAPMSLYAVETATAVALLVKTGGVPGQAHRLHAYQRLVDLGFPHLGVSLATAGILAAMLAIVLVVSPSWVAVSLALILAACYIGSPWVLERGRTSRSDKATRIGRT